MLPTTIKATPGLLLLLIPPFTTSFSSQPAIFSFSSKKSRGGCGNGEEEVDIFLVVGVPLLFFFLGEYFSIQYMGECETK
jgi:hypothetical protein